MKKWAGPTSLVSDGRRVAVYNTALPHARNVRVPAVGTHRSGVHLLDLAAVALGDHLALHLEARGQLPALDRQLAGQDAEAT